jgi:hypothetical protein
LTSQHELALLFLVVSVVQGTNTAAYAVHRYAMQGWMVAAIVHACGQVKADLLPFGQTQCRTQILGHAFCAVQKLTFEVRVDFVAFVRH